jgi:tetratricopeptide (TPR) repeat protein
MIVTFYSYKGGVGRSMALANVARQLQLQGLNVAMVDWDLEAPGLESFFAPTAEERDALRARLGLIDLLVAYQEMFPNLPREPPDSVAQGAPMPAGEGAARLAQESTVPAADVAKRRRARAMRLADGLDAVLPPLSHVLIPIKTPSALPATPPASSPGKLWLLSAGSRSGSKFNAYAETVQDFDWEEFYALYEGEAYFEWLRQQLLRPDVANIVLIDSRTGVAEMSGACTRQMADVIVMLCAPNDQNLEGVERMAESFVRPAIVEARGNRAIDLIMVPARVDISEGRPVDLFESNFRQKLDGFAPPFLKNLGVAFSKLRIPYIKAYAYGDRLAIGAPDGVKSLQDAYVTLAAHVAALAPPASRIRNAARYAIQETFGLPTVAVFPIDAAAAEFTGELQMRLETAGTLTVAVPTVDAVLDTDLQHRGPGAGPVPLVIATSELDTADRRIRDACRRLGEQGIASFIATAGPAPAEGDGSPRWLRRISIFDGRADFDSLLKAILTRPKVPRTPFTSPPPPEPFVDRSAEIGRLQADLAQTPSSRGSGAGIALVGPPGIGKTALASLVCHTDAIVDLFDDGIVWASLGLGANLLDVYSRVVASFTGEPPPFRTIDEARHGLVDLLARRRCLLVLDGVWDPGQLVTLGSGSTSRLLLTTRFRDVAAEAASVVSLGQLPTRDAAELLSANLRDLDPDALAALLLRLDGVPAALRVANRLLRARLEMGESSGHALATLAADLEEEGLATLDLGDAPDSSLLAAFRASAERLTSADRVRLAALSRLKPGEPISVARIGSELGLGPSEAEGLVRRVASASLIEFDAPHGLVTVPQLSRLFFQTLDAGQKRSEAALAGPGSQEQRIFISYVRADAVDYAGRLADRLARQFGYASVFLDATSVSPGDDYVDETDRAIESASVLVALIGPSWQKQLAPGSVVVRELSAALERGIRIIPVLIGGAQMPAASELPPPLAPLARRNAVEVSDVRFNQDVDRLVAVIERVHTPASKGPTPVPKAATRARRWVGIGVAATLTLAFALWTVWQTYVKPPPVANQPEIVSDARIGQALALRERGDVTGAITLLSQLLDGTTPPVVRAQALRDRAFCYKLQKDWAPSIGDLSTALALSTSSPAATAMTLKDRANAYREIPDLDAALADYETLTQLQPEDRQSKVDRDVMRRFLTPTQGFLFVFAPSGVIDSPRGLPVPVQKLDQISFLNLRFWWHTIPATEVRFTTPRDEQTAVEIVRQLESAGLEITGPTLLSSTVTRSRRIEVWLKMTGNVR